ncbi:MAG: ATP-binding cassette domain-containing protein, partial [Methylococcales bacterium]|nr:ATP-binding cassette domain-containing protein [Methylococcales bacterium]
MLEVQQLTCERDDRVLFANLDFCVQAGEVFQIEGANGSGKTTLLRILCGLNTDFSGRVFWKGQADFAERAELRADLLYLGHQPGIKKTLTALENLHWFGAMHGRFGGDVYH